MYSRSRIWGRRRRDTDDLIIALMLLPLVVGIITLLCLIFLATSSKSAQSTQTAEPPGESGDSGELDDPATANPTPWPDYSLRNLTICVNPEGGPPTERPLAELAAEALAMWQGAAGKPLPLTLGGLCPGVRPDQLDGVSVIGWVPVEGEAIGFAWRVPGRAGGIQEADIGLEPTHPSMADDRCLLSALLHELGHVLGLDHRDQGPSIMLPVNYCMPELSPADVDAIRLLYP